MIIGLVRGLPNKDEIDAAQGGALPLFRRASRNGSPSGNRS
jgi:hypothetical protein